MHHRPSNWHVTLLFIGNVDADRVADIAAAATVSREPLELVLDQPEVWHHGLAVLLATEVPMPLRALYEWLGSALRGCDLAIESRPYLLHVTRRGVMKLRSRQRQLYQWCGGYGVFPCHLNGRSGPALSSDSPAPLTEPNSPVYLVFSGAIVGLPDVQMGAAGRCRPVSDDLTVMPGPVELHNSQRFIGCIAENEEADDQQVTEHSDSRAAQPQSCTVSEKHVSHHLCG